MTARLAAYVFTNDITTVWRIAEGLEAGIIGVNDPVPTAVQCPFGGMRKAAKAAKDWLRIWKRSTFQSGSAENTSALR